MLCSFFTCEATPLLNGRIGHGSMLSGYKISPAHSASLLCLALLLPCLRAQSTSDSTSKALTWSTTLPPSGMITTFPSPTDRSSRSMAILSISSTSNTTSSSSNPTTQQTPSDIFPATTSPNDHGTHTNPVFNYYFLFLAVFGVLVVALLWWIHRKKNRRKELMRLSGQHALAQDLEGWAGSRRFMHGRYNQNQNTAFIRGEDGLDEHGEAPPPYQPKNDVTMAQEPVTAARDAASGLTVPPRSLPPDEIERALPPAYRSTPQPGPT